MKMRKTIAILTAVCAVFAFTGMAMAANRVEVKVTSEPIGYGALCDKAGGFSLEWDEGSTIVVGDQITIDLDYKSPSVYTSICKAVDLEISMGGSETPFLAANILAETDGPLQYVSDAAGTTLTDAAGGIYFQVTGAVNQQRITIDVLGAVGGSLIVGSGDTLVLNFLDQKSNAIDWALLTDEPGIYVDDDADGVYDVDATASDNTLCINVSAWDEATVDANMDSEADKFTFIPSDPQVAHIAAASSFSLVQCDKTGIDRVDCGTKGAVQGPDDTCDAFDYETGDGYITQYDTNRVIISKTTAFQLVNYQIRLEILVNGMGGDNGVYWTNEVVNADGYDTQAAACAVLPGALAALNDVGATVNYTYLNGAGLPAVAAAPALNECDVLDANRVVSLTTDVDDLDLAAGNDYLLIDIPSMNYDLDDITPDDAVSVRVTLIKAPCGTIFQGDIDVAIMCAAPAVEVLDSRTIVYPYFTAMANDNWWDGLVITNLGAAEGNFTALVYEQDGDVGAFTGIIDGNSMYQGTLSNALAGATLLVDTGSGVLGDSLCYILVCVDFHADGFAFMGSLSTNSLMANESMGYVPRIDYYDANKIPFCNNLAVVPGAIPAL